MWEDTVVIDWNIMEQAVQGNETDTQSVGLPVTGSDEHSDWVTESVQVGGEWDSFVGSCTGCIKGPSPRKTVLFPGSEDALQESRMGRKQRKWADWKGQEEPLRPTTSSPNCESTERRYADGCTSRDSESRGQYLQGYQQQDFQTFQKYVVDQMYKMEITIQNCETNIRNLQVENMTLQKKLGGVLSREALNEHTIKILQFELKRLKHLIPSEKEAGVLFHGCENILSNFYPTKIYYDGWEFDSAEHLYQYFKAVFHGEKVLADDISSASRADVAKSLSKKITVGPKWHKIKYDVMLNVLRVKTGQCEEFKQELRQTGERPLIHDIPDPVWGVGPDNLGQNLNGHLLEVVRAELAQSDDLEKNAMLELLSEFPYLKKESTFKEESTDLNWRKGAQSGCTPNVIKVSVATPMPVMRMQKKTSKWQGRALQSVNERNTAVVKPVFTSTGTRSGAAVDDGLTQDEGVGKFSSGVWKPKDLDPAQVSEHPDIAEVDRNHENLKEQRRPDPEDESNKRMEAMGFQNPGNIKPDLSCSEVNLPSTEDTRLKDTGDLTRQSDILKYRREERKETQDVRPKSSESRRQRATTAVRSTAPGNVVRCEDTREVKHSATGNQREDRHSTDIRHLEARPAGQGKSGEEKRRSRRTPHLAQSRQEKPSQNRFDSLRNLESEDLENVSHKDRNRKTTKEHSLRTEKRGDPGNEEIEQSFLVSGPSEGHKLRDVSVDEWPSLPSSGTR